MKQTEAGDMEVARVARASSYQSCYDCGPLLGDVSGTACGKRRLLLVTVTSRI